MRLEQGAVYLDLNNPNAGVVTATGDRAAGPSNLYVPKAEIAYEYWNRLLAIVLPADAPLGEPSGQSRIRKR